MKDLFDFVHKIHRGPAIAVQFIDKGKDRQFSSVADPKEFFVCGSTPLAASISMTAESAAIKVR